MKPDPAGATSASISLREYVEAKIEGEREIARTALGAVRAECRAETAALAAEFLVFKNTLAKETAEGKETIKDKMEVLNELRRAVETDRSLFVRGDKYDADMRARDERMNSVERVMSGRVDPIEKWQAGIVAAGLPAVVATHGARVKAMEDWRNKLLGIGVMIALFAGLVGALLMRLLSGVFGR